MVPRLVGALGVLAMLCGGCAQHDARPGNIGFGSNDLSIAVKPVPPIVQPSGTAIAGWSSVVMQDAYEEPGAVALEASGPYTLDSGDKLRIFVYAQPSLSRVYAVDSEGLISVPLIGNVRARGATTRGLESAIRSRLAAEFVRDPHVTVDIQLYRPFFILGEVKAAGQFPYVGGITVEGAVAIAGGYSERANERKVHITRRTKEGIEKLEVSGDFEVRPGDTIHVRERWF